MAQPTVTLSANRTFYSFYDLEKGNCLAFDKKCSVYSLVHDAVSMAKGMKISLNDILDKIAWAILINQSIWTDASLFLAANGFSSVRLDVLNKISMSSQRKNTRDLFTIQLAPAATHLPPPNPEISSH